VGLPIILLIALIQLAGLFEPGLQLVRTVQSGGFTDVGEWLGPGTVGEGLLAEQMAQARQFGPPSFQALGQLFQGRVVREETHDRANLIEKLLQGFDPVGALVQYRPLPQEGGNLGGQLFAPVGLLQACEQRG